MSKDADPTRWKCSAAILDGHDAARFNKKLVREDKVALSVDIELRQHDARGPGMPAFSARGSPAEGNRR